MCLQVSRSRGSVGSNTPVGSAHALASTIIAFENRDVLREDRKGGRNGEARAEGEPTRPGTERNYSPPTSHSPPAKKNTECVKTISGKYKKRRVNKLCRLFANAPEIFPRAVGALLKQHGQHPRSVVPKVWSGSNRSLWGRWEVGGGSRLFLAKYGVLTWL